MASKCQCEYECEYDWYI